MGQSLRVIAAGALLVGVYLRWVRPWELRWGATDVEVALRAAGDELVRDPNLVATRAVTVDAPPEAVWPWLVQIGTGRAGWYSYDVGGEESRPPRPLGLRSAIGRGMPAGPLPD